jgi:hypothetical protein
MTAVAPPSVCQSSFPPTGMTEISATSTVGSLQKTALALRIADAEELLRCNQAVGVRGGSLNRLHGPGTFVASNRMPQLHVTTI